MKGYSRQLFILLSFVVLPHISCSDSAHCALCLYLVLSSTSSARHRSDQTVGHFHPLSAAEQDVASLRVKKFETVFAQQSVRLPAAKVSRLAHDGGNQPMAPELSFGAPRESEREREGGGGGGGGSYTENSLLFGFKIKALRKCLKKSLFKVVSSNILSACMTCV